MVNQSGWGIKIRLKRAKMVSRIPKMITGRVLLFLATFFITIPPIQAAKEYPTRIRRDALIGSELTYNVNTTGSLRFNPAGAG